MFVQLAILVVAAVAAIIVIAVLVSRHSEQTARQMREQEERSQSAISQFREDVSRELGRLNSSLVTGVTDSGKAMAQAQQNMTDQLAGSQRMIQRLSEQLGAIQQAGRDLSESSKMLHNILGGVKTRGILGELALERMVADALPKEGYESQYRFSSGEVVDMIIRLGDHILPIDSKFPLDSYRRLAEEGDVARREFVQAVRKHIDSIAQKYIRPQDGTVEFAAMFVPSEGVYYELLVTNDEKIGNLAEYARERRVLAVSPNTLYAYLMAVLLGHKGMKLEQNARELLGRLAGLQKDLDAFAISFGKLGTHLRNARNNYEDAEQQLKQVQRSVEQLSAISLPPADGVEAPALAAAASRENS